MHRRTFIQKTLEFCLYLSIVFVGIIALYLYPFSRQKKQLTYLYASDISELSTHYPKRKNITYSTQDNRQIQLPVFLVLQGDSVKTFSAYCTHLGCLTLWDNAQKQILCPCHGGRYSLTGEVISGPPPERLKSLPVVIKDGKVYVGVEIAI